MEERLVPAPHSRSSQYFPPSRLSYFSPGAPPVYPFIGPVLPSVPGPASPPLPLVQTTPDTELSLVELCYGDAKVYVLFIIALTTFSVLLWQKELIIGILTP